MTIAEICRLECLKLAIVYAHEEAVAPDEIVGAAKLYYEFVSGGKPMSSSSSFQFNETFEA